jgi:hypothetical protein
MANYMGRAAVLLAWYFAVVGGTVGPFDSLSDCEAARGEYRGGAKGWTSQKCWEARGVEITK